MTRQAGEGARLARSLLAMLRPHRRALGVVAALSLAGSALSLAQPVLGPARDRRGRRGRPLDRPGHRAGRRGARRRRPDDHLLPRIGLDVVLAARRGLALHLLAHRGRHHPAADGGDRGDHPDRLGHPGGHGALVAMLLVDALLVGVTVAFVLGAVTLILLVSGRVRTISAQEQAHVGDMGAAVERVPGAARTIHLLQEYARHAGHLDVVRELIDGTVGE